MPGNRKKPSGRSPTTCELTERHPLTPVPQPTSPVCLSLPMAPAVMEKQKCSVVGGEDVAFQHSRREECKAEGRMLMFTL